jgi:hypothetical protein
MAASMTIRGITPSGDWTFGAGVGNYKTNEAAIEENIKTWLQSWVNNCFFALKDGVDWQNLLDVGQKQNLEDAIRANILLCYGVMGINSLTVIFDPRTRRISMTVNITTIYSQSFQLELSQIAGVTNG